MYSFIAKKIIGSLLAGWDEVIGVENGGGDEDVARHHIGIAEARLKHWVSKIDQGGIFG